MVTYFYTYDVARYIAFQLYGPFIIWIIWFIILKVLAEINSI